MPLMHRYLDKNSYYVRTRIGQAIITYHLTPEGEKKLKRAGVREGQRFRRWLLISLVLAGEAFTHGTGPGKVDITTMQVEPDLPSDPESASLFPRCASCGSYDDLHLVEIIDKQNRYLSLFCTACRKKGEFIDSSFPLPLVTRGLFERFQDIKGAIRLDKTALNHKKLLEQAFQEKWNDIATKKASAKRARQKSLFNKDDSQKRLI